MLLLKENARLLRVLQAKGRAIFVNEYVMLRFSTTQEVGSVPITFGRTFLRDY